MRNRPVSSSVVVLVGRILLVGIAGAAVVYALAARRGAEAPATAVSYACPMHPSVTSSVPGDCPICRMALEPVAPRDRNPREPSEEPQTIRLPDRDELRRLGATERAGRFDISLEMRAPAWAETAETGVAVYHRDEAELLEAGDEGLFFPSGPPRDGVPPGIPVRFVGEPTVRADAATASVRFRVAAGARLPADRTGTVKFATRARNDLVVRASAVLHSPEGPYVLVVGDDEQTITKRPVELGNLMAGYAAVVAGLGDEENVVVAHTALIDAERRFRGGAR